MVLDARDVGVLSREIKDGVPPTRWIRVPGSDVRGDSSPRKLVYFDVGRSPVEGDDSSAHVV